jgi:hypothetical protein
MMKRIQVLRYLPQLKTLTKEATTKGKQGIRLIDEAAKAREISDALKGVTLHNDFPIKTAKYSGGTEILSGCDDVKRSAYVKNTPNGTQYVVTTYRNDGTDIDGTLIGGEYKKVEAIRLAKDYVATGKREMAAKPKASRRGRVAVT